MHMPAAVEKERVRAVKTIQGVVAKHFYIPLERMLSKQRPAHVVWPRQIAMSIAYELSHLSTTQIAPLFNCKDHGTILHACSRVATEERSTNKAATSVRADILLCRALSKSALHKANL